VRALVTGAGGFVGGALCRALGDRGVRVVALEHHAPAAFADERVRGSLLDESVRCAAVRGVDAVYHCAARIDPASREELDAVNHRATVDLAEAAARAGVKRFVFVSSQAAIAGRGEGLIAEDVAPAPASAYGESKLAAERALFAAELGAMRLTIVRPPAVYGPHERRVFLTLARAISSGAFPILGSGGNRMSFCHVENLIEAIFFVEDRGGLFHVADARPVTQREAVRTIARALGVRTMPLHFPLLFARAIATASELAFSRAGRRAPLDRARLAVLTVDRALDTSRIAALGFVPKVGFDEGVRETIVGYRADGLLRA
jgi:nucleoside-diphosphate-sugar epimerase